MSMTTSISRGLVAASTAVLLLASWSLVDAKPSRGGGGGGGGGGQAAGARGGGGGGGQAARPQANQAKADSRSRDVRNTSVNNVSSNRNVNVNSSKNVNINVDNGGCCGGWDNDYHPVATAAAVTATVAMTSAVIGSMVNTVPTGCMPVNYGGMVYQQCGNTWYMPQGPQYVVVNPPY